MGFVQKAASGHAQPIRPTHAAYVTWVGQARPAPMENVSFRSSRALIGLCRGILLVLEESGPLASPSQMLMKMFDLGVAGPRGCSGHGECIQLTGKCLCDPMWNVVPSCSVRGCASNCTHGTCVDGTCECNPGFAGAVCDIYTCLNGCSGHGKCRLVRTS
jgi:hypothetical protein